MRTKYTRKDLNENRGEHFRISHGSVDISSKSNISVIQPSKENAKQTIKQLQNYSRQIEEVKKEFYSSNAAIERIMARSFADILRAVCTKEIHKLDKERVNTHRRK
nr:hypothetical protein [uncultured Agathobaculum sp.]